MKIEIGETAAGGRERAGIRIESKQRVSGKLFGRMSSNDER